MAKKSHVPQYMEQAVRAARAGNKDQARSLLQKVVAEDPQNKEAWLWMSTVVDGIDAQRSCLHRVLAIDPHDSLARSGLAFLSRLRVGQESLAAQAPWITSIGAEEAVESTGYNCPRCGTFNPAWSFTCSRCGATLRTVDVVKTAQDEIRSRSHASASPAVIESWGGALILNRRLTFEPELGLASLGRASTALLLGALCSTLLRAILALVTVALAGAPVLPALGRTGRAALLDGGLLLLGTFALALLLAVVTFPFARLMGGKGNWKEHLHMVAVALSSWLALSAVAALLSWLANFLPTAAQWMDSLHMAIDGLLLLYAIVLLTEALQTAHRSPMILALIVAGAALLGGGLLALALVGAETLRQVFTVLLIPLS